ncbi:MAG: type II toxin-antitoxin system antitoxin, RelB/DinJ family [Oscillibacter sp.]|nr:type II toxin-antitoxin system antitoxin, RelB/DinJ family [Oscillibacter sp.]
MAQEAVVQISMDSALMEQAEQLYRTMGMTLAEAFRVFTRRSVEENAMPSFAEIAGDKEKKPVRRIGIARGMKLYAEDYDIDAPDPEILGMFEVL